MIEITRPYSIFFTFVDSEVKLIGTNFIGYPIAYERRIVG